ncbi:Probable serine/threonine-protein kinase SIS8 [Linum grandiflorum]
MNGLSPMDAWMQQQELGSTFSGGAGRNAHNISMQTGEEFSMEFLQERANARGTRPMPNPGQTYDRRGSFNNNDLIHQLGYEDAARVITLKRMDSDVSASSMGSPRDNDNSYFVDKVTWVNVEDGGNVVHRSRMAFGELNDRGPTTSVFYAQESPRADNINGVVNFSDRHQSGRMKLLCSSGGKILPRPGDGKLRYVGGETRIISITKSLSWNDLVRKTSCICNQPHFIKYQLPGEDLDALISVSSDEDLQNMMEEYCGLESLGGSPRLRIFLIPMGEYDNLSSFEVTTSIQQDSPDFQYVVAVNGIVDPSIRNNCGERLSGSDSSAHPVKFNRNPSFHKRAPPSLLPLEINGGLNSFQNMRSPYPSPPISPAPCSPIPLHGDRSSMESNSSFMPASLSADNSSLNTGFHQQLQGSVALTTRYRYPCRHIDGGQCEQPYVMQYQNFHYNKDAGSPSGHCNGFYHERNIQRGHHFLSDNPISCSEDSGGVLMNDCFDAPHGMPHAYSDSKLQERGGMSAYCSQEGMGTSHQLKYSKTLVSPLSNSTTFREKPLQVLDSRHRALSITDDKYNVSISNENLMGSEATSKCDQIDPLLQQSKINFWEKPPIDCKKKLLNFNVDHLSSCGNSLSRNIQTPAEEYAAGEDLKPTISNLEHPQLESGPSGFQMNRVTTSDQPCAPTITVRLKQEPDMSITKIREVKLQKTSQHPNAETPLYGLVFQPSNNTFSLGENTIQSIEGQRGMCNSEHLQMRPVHAFPQVDENIAAKDFEKLNYGEPKDESSDTEDILLIRKRNPSEQNGRILLEPLVVTDGNEPSSVLVSSAAASRVTIPTSGSFVSAMVSEFTTPHVIVQPIAAKEISSDILSNVTTRLESVFQESELGGTEADEGDVDGCISDVAIAEMEASIYGLQIIKNSDLEELQELGSGTYGTVYHGKWRGTDVAIKRIKKSCFSGRSSEQERMTKDFWREAHILSTLHHPNVVAFYGIVPDGPGGTLATVTEFMVNGSLRLALVKKDKSLDRRKKLMIAMDAAFGMEYLHSKRIVHFDLKCDNLLVNLRDPHRPVCKVADFGLSRIKRNTLVSGGVRGTLPWMAPELLNGSSSRVSEKVDIFSFGISMWEILTGEEPYADMHCGAIIGGIVKNTLRPSVSEDCDQEWRKLMEQCWAPNPDSRPSFTEIAYRLRAMSLALQAKGTANQARLQTKPEP